MNKFKDIKSGQYPESDTFHPTPSGNPKEDGNLITKVLISDHGLNTNRFRTLTYERMLYCEELLCSIVQNLCVHLTKLENIRKNSPIIGSPPPY